jgi:Zn finger protein HypA/HybF involved in hydrogenase expression
MHELAMMQGVITTALAEMRAVGGTRVTGMHLTLGASGHLSEDATRQHFAALAQGTPVEGAALTFTWLPATYQCFDCLARFECERPAVAASCPTCGGVALEVRHQDVCVALTIDIANDSQRGDLCDAEVEADVIVPRSSRANGMRPAAPLRERDCARVYDDSGTGHTGAGRDV